MPFEAENPSTEEGAYENADLIYYYTFSVYLIWLNFLFYELVESKLPVVQKLKEFPQSIL